MIVCVRSGGGLRRYSGVGGGGWYLSLFLKSTKWLLCRAQSNHVHFSSLLHCGCLSIKKRRKKVTQLCNSHQAKHTKGGVSLTSISVAPLGNCGVVIKRAKDSIGHWTGAKNPRICP